MGRSRELRQRGTAAITRERKWSSGKKRTTRIEGASSRFSIKVSQVPKLLYIKLLDPTCRYEAYHGRNGASRADVPGLRWVGIWKQHCKWGR